MSRVVFSSLKTAVKGSALLVVSIAAGQVLWFLIRVLIVRNITQAELGIYALALTSMSIAAILSNLGLFEGVTRYISVARGKGDTVKVRGTIKSALTIILFSGLAATVVLFFLSDALAERVFDMPGLSTPLKVIALAVIISALIDIQMGILRGFGIMEVKAANAVANPLMYMALLAAVFLLKLPFISVIVAFVAANLLSLSGISIYTYKKLNFGEILSQKIKTYRRELLVFSLPLMGVALTGLVMTWTDTLMLGYFMEAEDVGIYNVGISLSKLLMFAVSILGFVFMPIAGELYARGRLEDLKRTYQVLTKWVFSATFPVFLVLFFFPEMTLTFLFGKQYETASAVLKLLSLRYMVTLLMGSSSLLLTVLGRPRLLLGIAILGSVLNIVLNYTMIPAYGLTGAALATLISSLAGLTLCTFFLYRLSGIHVFTSKYLVPVVASVVLALIIYALAKSLPLHFWMLPIYFILFIGGYLAAIVFTRSIEKEDIAMFEAVTGRLGVEMASIKKLLRRFAHE